MADRRFHGGFDPQGFLVTWIEPRRPEVRLPADDAGVRWRLLTMDELTDAIDRLGDQARAS